MDVLYFDFFENTLVNLLKFLSFLFFYHENSFNFNLTGLKVSKNTTYSLNPLLEWIWATWITFSPRRSKNKLSFFVSAKSICMFI